MKIEPGKRYQDRTGKVWGPMRYWVDGLWETGPMSQGETWCEDGRRWRIGHPADHPTDLVDEVSTPTPEPDMADPMNRKTADLLEDAARHALANPMPGPKQAVATETHPPERPPYDAMEAALGHLLRNGWIHPRMAQEAREAALEAALGHLLRNGSIHPRMAQEAREAALVPESGTLGDYERGRSDALADVRAYLEAQRDDWQVNRCGPQALALTVALRDCPLFHTMPDKGTTDEKARGMSSGP